MLVVRDKGKRMIVSDGFVLSRKRRLVFRTNDRKSPHARRQSACLLVAELRVAPQRHEREVEAVHVILEVKDLRKAGAGERLFAPVAVGPLSGKEVVNAA